MAVVVKRLHNALAKELVRLSLLSSRGGIFLVQIVFLSSGHFHKQKNESGSGGGRKKGDR